jgi:hypothetical protein
MKRLTLFLAIAMSISVVFAQDEIKKVIGIQVSQLATLTPQANKTYMLMTNPFGSEYEDWMVQVKGKDEYWIGHAYEYAVYSGGGWSFREPEINSEIELTYLGSNKSEFRQFDGTIWLQYNPPPIARKIGERYMGGTVVYLFQPGDANFGKYQGILVHDSYFEGKEWGCLGKLVIPTANAAEAGKRGNALLNHPKIMSNCPTSAAFFCAGLQADGQGGWILPTATELVAIFANFSKIKRPLYEGKYWTCLDANVNDAIVIQCQLMGDQSLRPMTTTQRKNLPASVYPVKYF